ncbi:50S ribosomal protein L6 [Candidatus Woesebacteria bacterium]|nr:50S ribosomal protein L6 [Candidatus Woesebacteria bacterium]
MARIGKLPVEIPEGLQVKIELPLVKVTGPKGSLERKIPEGLGINMEDKKLFVRVKKNTKANLANQGAIRSHLENMIKGVTQGWKKTLELVGAGYRAEVKGNELILTIGYSHLVTITAPIGIKFSVEKSLINIEGADIEEVGLLAAKIRVVRPPDSYKGMGIRYRDEVLRKKPGKQTAKVEGAG